MLDNRLQMCVDLVSGKGIVCDVGTDHALLAAELINTGKCRKVIASDIKEGPLEAAAKTVEKYSISDKVQLILSDGLKNVPLDGVSDVVIAGMGGETIADIIEAVPVDRYDHRSVRWILQPMTKPEVLRKRIYEMQMSIIEEHIVCDGDKMYVVMCAGYNRDFRYLTEFEALYGFFDEDDELAEKWRNALSDRLAKVADSLELSGRMEDAVHNKALSYKLKNGALPVDMAEIYDYLNSLYPFSTQEKWDNSGWLVESENTKCRTVLLALDISYPVTSEAACKQADLVISHHPVIFSPLKRITSNDPVHCLVYNNIAAMCLHTNLDIAKTGTNGVILRKLAEKYSFAAEHEPFEELGDGMSLGWIVELTEAVDSRELACELKKMLGCNCVRMTANSSGKVRRIAFCSGSGGSMLSLAAQKGCDALITGDVKHDVWISSQNMGITLIDCGHFHTENPVLWELRRVLEEKFPQLDVEIAERSTDPCEYV